MMNELFSFENHTADVDSKSQVHEDAFLLNQTSAGHTDGNANTTMLSLTTGITQISPYGNSVETDRNLLAPTPPLVMTEFDMNTASFLSPIAAEPPSTCNDANKSTIIAASVQSEYHRHVTPVPASTFSPVPPLASDILEVANSTKNDISDTVAFTQQRNATMKNNDHSITSENSVDHTSTQHFIYTAYSVSTHFPVIVHRMITETCTQHGQSLMYWSDCGQCFWIDQKHQMLSTILSQYFKHNRYQSLRRQLNAYGFGKYISGSKKGYWKHPKFRRDCTYKTLKSIQSVNRSFGFGHKKKTVKKRAAMLNDTDEIHMNKGTSVETLAPPPVKTVEVSSIPMTEGLIPNKEVANAIMNRDKTYMLQLDDLDCSYKNKIYTGDRRVGASTSGLDEKAMEIEAATNAMTSDPEVYALHTDDSLLSEPIMDSGYDIPPFFDDSSSDALTALATVASFLPIAPMPLYTPISKNIDIVRPIPIHQETPSRIDVSPQNINMTILAEAAFWCSSTPIKVPTETKSDQTPPWNDGVDCCFDDNISSYSVGSLSSPMKLILPFSDRSAFTPVVSSIDHMVVECYKSL